MNRGSGAKLSRDQVLALDIATACGFYSVHGSGTWNLRQTTTRKTYLAFYTTLKQFIIEHGIIKLVVEDLNVNKYFNDLRKLAQLHGIMLLVSEELDMLPVEFVNVRTLKKWATGDGNATKQQMMAACANHYRFYPQDDNQADACHLYYYFVRKWRIT